MDLVVEGNLLFSSFNSSLLFRLELPSKKSIGVKAKQTKLVEEVLRPILQQYGWNLDQMLVQVRTLQLLPNDAETCLTLRLIISPLLLT